jgi:Cu-processing system permease protein
MHTYLKISLFGLRDLIRNRWSITYTLFFLIVTDGLVRLIGDVSRITLTLMNIILFIIPLVSVLFGALYFYNSREFFKFLLVQPVRRSTIYISQLTALVVSLSAGFTLGTALPFLLHGMAFRVEPASWLLFLGSGWCLTAVFVGLAFLLSVVINDKGKGISFVLFAWLFAAVIYDGILLFIANLFSAYPLEKPMILLTTLNPIDLARILFLIHRDISALMGYTGAVFNRFFGDSIGILVSIFCLAIWSVLPAALGLRLFVKKDL